MPFQPGYRLLQAEYPTPRDFLDHYDDKHATLFVPTSEALRAGDKVMAEFGFTGQRMKFAVRGTVRWLRASGTTQMPAGASLQIHADDRGRIKKAHRIALGEAVTYVHREQTRYPADVEVRYLANGSVAADGRLLDISVGGAFIRTMGTLPQIGADIQVEMRPPGWFFRKLKVKARVMWLDFFEESRGMGVRFMEKNPKVETLVEKLRGNA